MIRILIIVVALLTGLIFAPELSANRGYLLISFDRYTTYQTTIINAGFILLVLYFVLLGFEWILRRLLSMSSITRGWLGQRKTRNAQKNSLRGTLALLEGNTKQAEKLLSKSAAQSEAPTLTYIDAARASNKNGDFKKRDDHLASANESPNCKLAVGLVSVELQLEAKQYAIALATLKELDLNFPKNKQILQHYLAIYPGLNEWEKLISLINTQRKLTALNDQEFADLELHAHQQLFRKLAAENGDLLSDYWNKNVARGLKKELVYQEAILSAFIVEGCGNLAREFLLDRLQRDFSLPLLPYLQKLEITDHYPIITFLEKQLKKTKYSDYVHQALGYLKLKENHPEAAVMHFKESVKTLPVVADYQLLASLLAEQGKSDDANLYYRQGLEYAAQLTPLVELSTNK